MKSDSNNWDASLSGAIPYVECNELFRGNLHAWNAQRHNNACYELHIILEGCCALDIESDYISLHAGQAVLIAPMCYHVPSQVSQPFLRFPVCFLFDESSFPQKCLLSLETNSPFGITPEIDLLCRSTLHEILSPDGIFSNELISSAISQILIRSLRILGLNMSIDKHTIPVSYRSKERLIIDNFFATTPPEQRNQKNLAQLLHCSQRQLVRKLYDLYGVSFRQKLMDTRIDLAQYLLCKTSKSIGEISMLVGFSDSAAFYRAFRGQLGTTPSEYRKKHSKQ